MQISKINTINSNPNFCAKFSKEIKSQIEDGKQRYQEDKKALAYYNLRVNEAKSVQPEITIDTYNPGSSLENIYGKDIVVFKRDGITICRPMIQKARAVTYIEADDLKTLEGVTALGESLRSI